ncbi:bifunctional glutamine-synthetase adenylyltransferase/deadenyltransferase, partial [Streptomonospora algeriensis]
MTAGALARRGFGDGTRAARLMQDCGLDPARHSGIVEELGAAPDADQALLGLSRLLESCAERGDLLEALTTDPDLRSRLIKVLGASSALTDHLVRHPGDWRELRGADAARAP